MDGGHPSIVEGFPDALLSSVGVGGEGLRHGKMMPNAQSTASTGQNVGGDDDDGSDLRSQLYRSLFPMPVPQEQRLAGAQPSRLVHDHVPHVPSGLSLPFSTVSQGPSPSVGMDAGDLAALLTAVSPPPPPPAGLEAALLTPQSYAQLNVPATHAQGWSMDLSLSTAGSTSSFGRSEDRASVSQSSGARRPGMPRGMTDDSSTTAGGSVSAASHQSSPMTGLSPHSAGSLPSSSPSFAFPPRTEALLGASPLPSSSSSSLVNRPAPPVGGRHERRSLHEPYDRPAMGTAQTTSFNVSESPEHSIGHDAGQDGAGGEDGKPFVACRKCRSRKIRCDGAKPVCKNCIKKGCECSYDDSVRRRGPDKEPGARSKRREARLAAAGQQSSSAPRSGSSSRESPQQNAVQRHQRRSSASTHPPDFDASDTGSIPEWLLQNKSAQHVFDIPISVEVPILPQQAAAPLNAVPIVTYEALQMPLNIAYERLPNAEYARSSDWTWMAHMLHPTDRVEGLRLLYEEMRYFFNLNFLWFAWFNRSLFFTRLHGTDPHLTLQPALVLAILAITTLLRSSELAPDCQERLNAIFFADQALAMIQQAFAAQSTDSTLAYAAFLLAAFETCPHPRHSTNRFCAAVKLMDSTIKAFCLLSIDADNPRTSIFVEGFVPSPEAGMSTATCIAVRPPQRDSRKSDEDGGDEKVLQRWAPQPQWPVEWTTAETQKDESRRMAWTASSMAASANLWLHTVQAPLMRLHLGSLSEYALLFPAEPLLLNEDPLAGKITLWALYNRTILLWHFAISTFGRALDDTQKREIASSIWAETETIESRLFDIAMDGGDLQKWQAQDYLVGLRMIVLKLYCPPTANPDDMLIQGVPMDRRTLFRHTALQWLASQSQVAKVLKSSSSAGTPSGIAPSLKNRPFFVWFLARSLKIALDLHEAMPGLPQAMQMAEGLVKVIEILVAAWPCATIHQRWQELAGRYNRILAAQLGVRKNSFSA